MLMKEVEILTYNPDNPDTFPSVCHTPEEVQRRFGFVGGEQLLFDSRGNYIGQVVKELDEG